MTTSIRHTNVQSTNDVLARQSQDVAATPESQPSRTTNEVARATDGFDVRSEQNLRAQRFVAATQAKGVQAGNAEAAPPPANNALQQEVAQNTQAAHCRPVRPIPRPNQPVVGLDKQGNLNIQGTEGNDDLSLSQKNGLISVSSQGKVIRVFSADQVKGINISTGDGKDRVKLHGIDSGLVRVNTGKGDDLVQAFHSKNLHIRTGAGDDGVDVGGSSNVLVQTGTGADTVQSRDNNNLAVGLGRGDDKFTDQRSQGLYAHGGEGRDSFGLLSTKNALVNGGRGGLKAGLKNEDSTRVYGGRNVWTQNTSRTDHSPFVTMLGGIDSHPFPARPHWDTSAWDNSRANGGDFICTLPPDPGLGTTTGQPGSVKLHTPDFDGYVSQHKDLELAWRDMRGAGTQNAYKGVYAQTYGKGLSEQTLVDQWNALGGKQISDIGQLSKSEWGMLHYQLHGKGEGRTLPSQVVEQKTTNEVFSNYVLNNTDLNLAYRAMGRDGALSAAQMNEYKATYGKGLNEKHFIDGWNRLNPQQPISDIGQLSQAEWGMLHYLLHGRHEGRPLKKSVEQATRLAA